MTHRYPQGASLGGRARLGDVNPTHRGCLVGTGLGSFQQGSFQQAPLQPFQHAQLAPFITSAGR